MFVRKKKNRSGTTSVVVVDKHGGKFKELHTVGIANSDEEIEKLLIQGKAWINSYLGVQKLDFTVRRGRRKNSMQPKLCLAMWSQYC